jgi:Carboxypeptidase regulatory-like domain
MNLRSSCILSILFGLITHLAVAQVTTGTITGFVNDSARAAVPGATVVATQLETGVRAQTSTSSAGIYVILDLAVGTYQLSRSSSRHGRFLVF